MAGNLDKKLLALLGCTLVYFGCVGEPGEPEFSPDRLHVDVDAATSQTARLMVSNPGPADRTLEVETSSERIDVDPARVTISGDDVQRFIVMAHCPAEPGDYEESIELSDPDRADSFTVGVDLRCHPAPASGEGTLSIVIEGLPDGARGNVELKGPDFVEAMMTEDTQLPELPSGRYSLTATAVDVDGQTYYPSPSEMDLVLWPDESHNLIFSYATPDELESDPPDVDHYVIAMGHGPRGLRSLIDDIDDDTIIELPSSTREYQIVGGPIVIDRKVTIRASKPAAPMTTGGRHGAFYIAPSGELRLEGVELRDAAGPRAPAIENHGGLYLVDTALFDNHRAMGPAAIWSNGTIIADGLDLQQNRTHDGPGAVEIADGEGYIANLIAIENHGSSGGAIKNRGSLYLDDSQFSHNGASEGGAIYNRGQLHMRHSAFRHNRGLGGDSFGGALLSERRTNISNTTFAHNSSTFGSALVVDAGQTEIDDVSFESNPSIGGSDVYVGYAGHLTARNCRFSGDDINPMSIDIVGNGTLVSQGGNIVPEPAGLWPDDIPEPGDTLGAVHRN